MGVTTRNVGAWPALVGAAWLAGACPLSHKAPSGPARATLTALPTHICVPERVDLAWDTNGTRVQLDATPPLVDATPLSSRHVDASGMLSVIVWADDTTFRVDAHIDGLPEPSASASATAAVTVVPVEPDHEDHLVELPGSCANGLPVWALTIDDALWSGRARVRRVQNRNAVPVRVRHRGAGDTRTADIGPALAFTETFAAQVVSGEWQVTPLVPVGPVWCPPPGEPVPERAPPGRLLPVAVPLYLNLTVACVP